MVTEQLMPEIDIASACHDICGTAENVFHDTHIAKISIDLMLHIIL